MNSINIFEKLNFIDVLFLVLRRNHHIYFIKSNFTSKFFSFFGVKKIKKLEWNLIDLENNNQKIITNIIEENKVDKNVYKILNFFSEKIQLENNFFHYLIKYFSNHNVIGNFSIENFLVLVEASNILFKNKKKIFFLESTEINDFIKKNYENENLLFIFKRKFFDFKNLKNFFIILKNLKYVFYKFKIDRNKQKSIAVMDSFEINKPKEFFNLKEFSDKTIFLSNDNNHNMSDIINIYHYIDLNIIINTLKELFNDNQNFKSFKLLRYLYINFYFQKLIFKKIFKIYHIKKFVSSHIAQIFTSSGIAAIHELNGKSFGFTMSFCEKYSSHLNIDAFDYFISFNNSTYKKVENSNLKLIREIGYIGDYKFKKKFKEGVEIKKNLKEKGVNYIIGFFDQGYSKNSMFNVHYNVSKKGYEFLLNKIILHEDIGLIIKPKKPALLKEKLGKVYDLLIEAQKTGRVILFDKHPIYHSKNFEDTPAKVAAASNISIHDTLLAGTAGLESALTGTKSVYFDYYNARKSQFDNNDLKIVFRDWNSLWEEILKDYKYGNQSLGNWTGIIKKFDMTRDGKANLRIMNFLNNNQ